MVFNNTMSASTMAFNAVMPSWLSGVFIVALMAGILATAYLLSMHFRQFVYGMVVLVPVGASFLLSRSVTVNMNKGNYTPLLWVMGIIITVLASLGVGKIVQNSKFGKELEKGLQDMEIKHNG